MVNKFSFYFSGKGRLLYRQPDCKAMFAAFFREVLFQKHIAQRSFLRWSVHMLVFWGFIGLLSLSAIAVALETIIPESSGISQYMLHGQGHNYYKLAGDLFGLMLLAGVAAAFLRRFVFRAEQLNTDSTDTTTLVFLLL
jgi:heterodisulfide reductase subunit E